jgi:hypothetical protein
LLELPSDIGFERYIKNFDAWILTIFYLSYFFLSSKVY